MEEKPVDLTVILGRPAEKCGIFGIYGKGMEAARLTHAGLWALQHRGQESSGIASTEGTSIRIYKDQGLVSHVYDEEHLALLSGHAAIGHNRYATSGGGDKKHAQPVFSPGDVVALAHNGNLPSTTALSQYLDLLTLSHVDRNDSEMMQIAINHSLSAGKSMRQTLLSVLPHCTGAYCLLLLTKDRVVAVRDPYGIRPLSIGKINGDYVISSETCALDTIGASYIRDVKPGEMITISNKGLHSTQLFAGKEQLDIFEFIYFARSDSMLLGKRVDQVRKALGRQLAVETKTKLDVIVPVPDSAISAALGFSRESGVPFDHGLVKNRYIHRTFIQPAQKLREDQVRMKLIPIPEVLAGKRVGVVDDSIVRGTTAKQLVALIRRAGAKEVHLLITSPPVRYPGYYGIDTPCQADLIAHTHPEKDIASLVGADSVQFLSYDGLIKATGISEKYFCTACFSGKYPVSLKERMKEVTFKSLS